MAVRRENGKNTDRPRTDQNFSRQGSGSSGSGGRPYSGPSFSRGASASMQNTPSSSNENTDND